MTPWQVQHSHSLTPASNDLLQRNTPHRLCRPWPRGRPTWTSVIKSFEPSATFAIAHSCFVTPWCACASGAQNCGPTRQASLRRIRHRSAERPFAWQVGNVPLLPLGSNLVPLLSEPKTAELLPIVETLFDSKPGRWRSSALRQFQLSPCPRDLLRMVDVSLALQGVLVWASCSVHPCFCSGSFHNHCLTLVEPRFHKTYLCIILCSPSSYSIFN